MRRIGVALLLGSALSSPVHADEATQWLLRMPKAEQQHSFQGTFVYERNGSFSSHAIWHRVDGSGKIHERLLQLDGQPQEMLRVDGTTRCVSGGLTQQVTHGQFIGRQFKPDQLSQWYDIRVTGESRVADRKAVVVVLVPRDQHRFGFELHLDRESGLPLRTLMLDDKGHLLERFQFTNLELDSVPDERQMRPRGDCQPLVSLPSEPLSGQPWKAEWLPPGFELLQAFQQPPREGRKGGAWLVYGDGLARFSVFLEPLDGAPGQDARSQLGPTVAVSRRLDMGEGGVMATVVGEIPLGTAERIALSMRGTGDGVAAQ